MVRVGILILIIAVLPLHVAAQANSSEHATLIADELRIENDGRLIAEGSVQVFYGENQLSATRIIYDSNSEQLLIEGPIRLTEPSGATFLASSAELDADLTNGILYSARLVLDEQLQLAASEISRANGRYTQLTQVAASSCQVCGGEAPLWEIRAKGVVHDQAERQLYFENAQFRVAGVPIMYIPRLRLPDPTLKRATGFLLPDLKTTSQLSTGIKAPYFVVLDDSSDVTLTPYLSTGTTTLETRYRKVFRNGNLQFDGAFTFRDDILKNENRGYGFLRGGFNLPKDFRLKFDLEYASDPGYGLDYDYFDKDRLDSQIAISRIKDDEFLRAGLIYYETLREADAGIEDTLPQFVGEFIYSRRLPKTALGGEAWITFDGRTLTRNSGTDIVGRDDTRFGADIDWHRNWLLPMGIVAELDTGVSLETYYVRDDSTFKSSPSRAIPRVAATFRWPFERTLASGDRQLLEPVAMLAWSESSGDAVPNEDSLLVEFDEGNLFAFSRYPGIDAQEEGLRANLGFNWRHEGTNGLMIGVTGGRIYRFSKTDQFAEGTGLDGEFSDWLAALQVRFRNNLSLTTRALFDDDLKVTRNETRVSWVDSWGYLSTGYFWAVPVPEEGRPDRLSEWALSASATLDKNWTGSTFWRYDFVANRAARAGVGLKYQNECVGVDLSVSRRFTTSSNVNPTTDFNVSVSLSGFGTGNDGAQYRRSCGG